METIWHGNLLSSQEFSDVLLFYNPTEAADTALIIGTSLLISALIIGFSAMEAPNHNNRCLEKRMVFDKQMNLTWECVDRKR